MLLAPDSKGRPVWGIASGSPFEVKKGRSIGPLKDASLISKHRAPYKCVLPHTLPLFAKEAGTPVFNAKTEFIGIHFARLNRTLGLILLAKDIKISVDKMVESLAEKK